jgi:hypothetical protein
LYKSKLPKPYIDYTRLLLNVSIFYTWCDIFSKKIMVDISTLCLYAIITNIINIYR